MSTALDSIRNALQFAVTGKHWLEGRFDPQRNLYRNWDNSYRAQPAEYLLPDSEAAIRDVVLRATQLGSVGAGHSFNDLHLRHRSLLSLDAYKGLVRFDLPARTATFRAGTRVREAVRILDLLGLALPVLPDHNAQSLAGLLATDVHASGSPAHVSQAVTQIRLIDGRGQALDLRPNDPLFRATVGGMGCTGVISEVTFLCREPFHLETQAFRVSWQDMLDNLDSWRAQYRCVAAGYFPAFDACLVEVKREVPARLSLLGRPRETTRHVAEALLQTCALPYTFGDDGLRARAARAVLDQTTRHLREHSRLVLPSYEGFNRNVYQVHKEAEFTVPLEAAREVLQRGHALIRQHPHERTYLFGIRVSTCNERTLIGPGAGSQERSVAWIAPHYDGNAEAPGNDALWRALVVEYRGRPHYGKNMLGLDGDYLARVHGESFRQYVELLRRHDPERKFANALIPPFEPGFDHAPVVEAE